jgi:hypothetical protein
MPTNSEHFKIKAEFKGLLQAFERLSPPHRRLVVALGRLPAAATLPGGGESAGAWKNHGARNWL